MSEKKVSKNWGSDLIWKGIIGVILSFVILSAGFLGNYIYWQANEPDKTIYRIKFDYHNFSTTDSDIVGFSIEYRDTSDLLNTTVKNFAGFSIRNDDAFIYLNYSNQESMIYNTSYWKYDLLIYKKEKGYVYIDEVDIFGEDQGMNGYMNEFLINEHFIAYEVNLLSHTLLSALNTCESAESETFDYNTEFSAHIYYKNRTRVSISQIGNDIIKKVIANQTEFTISVDENGLAINRAYDILSEKQYYLNTAIMDFHFVLADYIDNHISIEET